MEQFVAFITNHWILASFMAVVLVAFLANELIQQRLGASQVSPQYAVQLINHQEAVVFDTRSEPLFSAGHILGAQSVPLSSLDKKMGSLQKYTKKPIIVACTVGQEATKMAEKLKEKGFLRVMVLSGGMQSWKAAGLPVVKV